MAEFQIPVIDYGTRDYEGTRDLLIALIPFFTSEWTDHNPSDFGIVLLEEVAVAADILHFYLDRMTRQCFLPTLTTRRAAVNLLKLIDYELASASPARTNLVFTLAAVQVVDVSIPVGTRVSTSGTGALVFETEEELIIPAGKLGDEQTVPGVWDYPVAAVEGETVTEFVDDSTGMAFQERTFTNEVILDEPFQIFIDEGGGNEEWTIQDSFALSSGTDKVFTRDRDENDIVTIRFGDNGSGKIPNINATIHGLFRIITEDRGGVDGNVGADTLTTLIDTVTVGGNPVTLSVTNPEQAQEGEARETIEEARVRAPLALRSLNRIVSQEDYKSKSESYAGVAKVQVIAGELPYGVEIHIVPEGGGVNPGFATQSLKDNLKTYIEGIQVFRNEIYVLDPIYVTIELAGVVTVESNYKRTTVETAVKAALNAYFNSETGDVDFAQDIRFSDLDRVVDSVDGVAYIEWSRFTMTPYPVYVVRGGDWTIQAISISPLALRETWTIYFFSTPLGGPYEFNVTGSTSGPQTATGQIGVPYTTDNGSVTFTVVGGTAPPTLFDRATFRTSVVIGSVLLEDTEFPKHGGLGNLIFQGGSA